MTRRSWVFAGVGAALVFGALWRRALAQKRDSTVTAQQRCRVDQVQLVGTELPSGRLCTMTSVPSPPLTLERGDRVQVIIKRIATLPRPRA